MLCRQLYYFNPVKHWKNAVECDKLQVVNHELMGLTPRLPQQSLWYSGLAEDIFLCLALRMPDSHCAGSTENSETGLNKGCSWNNCKDVHVIAG